MEKTAAEVRAEIARLEHKLASMNRPAKQVVAHEKSATRTLLAEIDEMEEQIAAMDAPEEMMAADEEDEFAEDCEDSEFTEEEDEFTASEDKAGVEDEITQDKFEEVEGTQKSAPGTSGDSVLDVAPTGYTARLMQASQRLDRVAAYLEQHGKVKLALRIDRVADAIDAQLQKA